MTFDSFRKYVIFMLLYLRSGQVGKDSDQRVPEMSDCKFYMKGMLM